MSEQLEKLLAIGEQIAALRFRADVLGLRSASWALEQAEDALHLECVRLVEASAVTAATEAAQEGEGGG